MIHDIDRLLAERPFLFFSLIGVMGIFGLFTRLYIDGRLTAPQVVLFDLALTVVVMCLVESPLLKK